MKGGGSTDSVHILMDPVHGPSDHGGGPLTSGPCFVLSCLICGFGLNFHLRFLSSLGSTEFDKPLLSIWKREDDK